MRDKISISKYVLILVLLATLFVGGFIGWYFTHDRYQNSEQARLAEEDRHQRQDVLCSVELMRGKRGDVKSDYYILEQSEKQETCEQFINYNVPSDTEIYWLGY